MNILFIGNSYTYYHNMPDIFERLANDNRKNVKAYSSTQGGRKLIAYTDAADEVTVHLDTLLSARHYDICFIQEQSVLPASDYESFLRGLDCVISKTNGHTGQRVLYATWGRKSGSETLSEFGWTTQSMAQMLSAAYHNAAAQYGLDVSDVGIKFLEVYQSHPEIELYDADLTHPSRLGSCLAALTHYYTVFGEFPENTESLSLSSAELAIFKKAICS